MTTRGLLAPFLAWLGAVVVAGCASPPRVEVVLLPQEDGSSSAVQVWTDNASQTLSRPYQRLVATPGTAPKVDQADPAELARGLPSLFAVRPPKPEHFTVYFETGSAGLTEASQATLGQLLDAAAQRAGADIVVIGHTDTLGGTESNDALSLERAQQVRTMLLQRQLFVLHQFPGQRIEAVGRGERELAVPTADEVDEPRNRRVEILLR